MPLQEVLGTDRANAVAVWVVAAGLLAAAAYRAWHGEWLWTALALAAVGLTAVPAVAHRNWRIVPPSWVPLFVAAPLVVRPYQPFAHVATYTAVAVLALMTAVNLNALTEVELSRRMGVLFVVTTTMGLSGLWVMLVGLGDMFLGMNHVAGMAELNREFIASVLTGVVGGVVFERYFQHVERGGLRGFPEEPVGS
jgi:signal transduction histidine kinase